jgi:hypothetical protein
VRIPPNQYLLVSGSMPGVAVICKIPTWARRIKLLKIAKLWLRRFAATRPGRRKPRLPKKLS